MFSQYKIMTNTPQKRYTTKLLKYRGHCAVKNTMLFDSFRNSIIIIIIYRERVNKIKLSIIFLVVVLFFYTKACLFLTIFILLQSSPLLFSTIFFLKFLSSTFVCESLVVRLINLIRGTLYCCCLLLRLLAFLVTLVDLKF